MQALPTIRIFVSSPGDLREAGDRQQVQDLVERLSKDASFERRCALQCLSWDDAQRKLLFVAGQSPQRSVDDRLGTPGDCDIVIGLFWSRLGTPVTRDGEAFPSGTAWELHDARHGAAEPRMILLRREPLPPPPKDRGARDAFNDELDRLDAYVDELAEPVNPYPADKLVEHLEPTLRAEIEARLKDLPPAAKPPEGPPQLPRAYLDWLWRACVGIDLLGQDVRQGRAITLNQVYVPAVTPARRPDAEPTARGMGSDEDRGPDLLLARLDEGSLFVSAPAGAGKSTFCRWAALRCHPDAPAEHPVPPPQGFAEPEPRELRRRLPLLVPLRELATTMDAGRGQRTWSRAGLEAALAAWVDATGRDGLTGDLLRAHLAHGSAFVMLDGLDEVATSEERAGVTVYPRARLLAGLADALPAWEQAGNRTLVTSRPYGLDDAGLARLGLDRAPLDALPEPLQALFVRRWFHTLDKPDLVEPLLAAMRQREDLAPLIENPLLLTAVCVLYDNGGRLPEDRYELYRSIVGLVLHSRYPGDARQREPVLRRLEAVAHAMHTGAPAGDQRKTPAAEVGWMEVERALADFANVNPTYAEGAVDAAVQREELLHRSGLLVPRANERAAFYHLSFQEFLAAQRIVRTSDDVAAVFRGRAPVAEWRPTLLFLLAAQIQNRDPEWAMNLLTRLMAKQKPLTRRANPAPMPFVAEALDLCLAKGYRVPVPLAARFRELALGAIEAEIDLQARQSLGLTLGRLGDPRVTDLRDPASYLEVPAGTYPVGAEGRTLEITAPFRLGRYPVTNGQYRAFVEDGGYGERRWWSEAGWAWRQKQGAEEPRYWLDRRWNAPNQPVVGVSFWEAEACAAWAGGRLPTAEESEAAARGTAGRTYPWGERWRDGICNTLEARLGVTSPVGLFPSSRHPDGFEDLAGNVFEWCEDPEGDPARPRVLRGGSWVFPRGLARCADRFNILPCNRDDNIGFRVVCSSPIVTAEP